MYICFPATLNRPTTVLHQFVKLRADSDWGAFDARVELTESAVPAPVPMRDTSQKQRRQATTVPPKTVTIPGPRPEPSAVAAATGAQSGGSIVGSIELIGEKRGVGTRPEISCPVCTLLNPADAMRCEACGEDLCKAAGHISSLI